MNIVVDKLLKSDPAYIYAPVDGKVTALEDFADPLFAEGVLGPGIVIEPEEGMIYAPFMGEVTSVSESKNAIGLKCFTGVEVLIHIGVDTVRMKGEGFQVIAEKGKKIRTGDVLISFDPETISEAGLVNSIVMVVPNAAKFDGIVMVSQLGENVKHGERLMKIPSLDK